MLPLPLLLVLVRLTRSIAVARSRWLLLPFVLGACGPALVPTPAPTPTAAPTPTPPAPVARPAATGPARYTLPRSIPVSSYTVSLRVQLERDSAGRTQRESIESNGAVTLTLRRDPRGGLRGTGRVEGYILRAGGALAGGMTAGSTANPRSSTPVRAPGTAGSDVPLSVSLLLALDSTGASAVVQPALANECDRPETAAAGLARDLLVRVPDSVATGDRWRDSLVSVVCRGGIPLTLRTTIETTLQETSRRGDATVLLLRREIRTRMDGSSHSPWRPVTITGDGTGTQRVQMDAGRGTIIELDGESVLTVRIGGVSGPASPAMEQRVVQRSTLQARSTR